MRCYICNRELKDKPIGDSECQAHGEHIIHNGIRGKLISKTILCTDCGCQYSKDDASFCKIFAPFMAALKDRMITSDHGKDTLKILPGSLFDSPTSNPDDPSLLVNARGGVVTPVEPFHENDGDKITVYAEKHRIDQYINVLAKQLKDEGKNINDYAVEKVTDMHDKGYLAYFFSKGNATFNDDFKKGMVKIATEFALHCGVPREQLTEVLSINGDGTSTFDCTSTKMFPFIPTSLFDVLFEDYRYYYEEGYPSHTLKLFTTQYEDGKTVLYCYLDLFSTFQYYVILNEDYKGDEVNETYAQRLFPMPKEKPDVSQCDPGDLDIVIREYGIDMSQCTVTTYEGQLKFVKECIRSYPTHTYDIYKALNQVSTRLQNIATAAVCKKQISEELDGMLEGLMKTAYSQEVVEQVEKQLNELTKQMTIVERMQTVNSFTASVEPEYYRKYGFDVIDGDVTNFSIPDEGMKVFAEHKEAAQVYTNAKFSHLGCLCYKPECLK